MRAPFPEVIDSSFLAAVASCEQKAGYEYIEHYKPLAPNVHLHAGASYAKGLEAARLSFYVEGKPVEESIALGIGALLHHYGDFECPEDSAKSATRMAGALEYYFSAYPLGQDTATPLVLPDGKRAIEFSFLEPIGLKHPITGNPLLMAGRSDMICDFAGQRYIEDDKTTSQLGASWSRQWDLRSQFTCYCWAAKQYGTPVDGVLVRGVSILKTKYDTLQAITYRPDWQIDRWYQQMIRNVRRIIDQWSRGFYDLDLNEACNAYGGCPFRQVCMSQDPSPWLNTYFERRVWDPVHRTETRIDENFQPLKVVRHG